MFPLTDVVECIENITRFAKSIQLAVTPSEKFLPVVTAKTAGDDENYALNNGKPTSALPTNISSPCAY